VPVTRWLHPRIGTRVTHRTGASAGAGGGTLPGIARAREGAAPRGGPTTRRPGGGDSRRRSTAGGGRANADSKVDFADQADDSKRSRRWSNLLLAVGAFLARVLQMLVLHLEAAIEWLGHEPERRWENLLFLRGMEVSAPNVPKLTRRAATLHERGDGEGALRLYVKILELEPDNTSILDAAAEVLSELGDAEGAKELLYKSIELSPKRGHAKYVLLGHLDCGTSAIASFEKALEILELEMSALSGPGTEGDSEILKQRAALKRKMSEVLTAVAKVYLTDCAEERNAQGICEELLDQSLLYDPDNPESTQALADLRMSQGRRGEALLMVRRTIDICGALEEGFLPSYDFRCVTARLLVELSQYELAEGVLVELVSEDDQDTEVWYLLGLCCLLLGQPRKCREALTEAKTLLERSPHASEATLMEQISALLERRAISEQEKTQFWNPRWWINDDGTADSSASAGSAANDDAELRRDTVLSETSILLKTPSKAPGHLAGAEFASIPEEPDDARMLLSV